MAAKLPITEVFSQHPELMSGALVFKGTRIPRRPFSITSITAARSSNFSSGMKARAASNARPQRKSGWQDHGLESPIRSGLPKPLQRFLVGHEVRRAFQEGLSDNRNGELLPLAE
jgi:hypothetical protein